VARQRKYRSKYSKQRLNLLVSIEETTPFHTYHVLDVSSPIRKLLVDKHQDASRAVYLKLLRENMDLYGVAKAGVAKAGVAKAWTESAGINRHIVGDERALQKRRSDSILASSLACELARDHSEA
jgi:hypothetical protein